MAVKGFAETHLQQTNMVIMTSLDVQGGFRRGLVASDTVQLKKITVLQ